MQGKILIVDDDPLMVRSTVRLLRKLFELETCLSAAEAVSRLESGEKFDIIISDLNMPEMNGIAFLKKANEISPSSIFYMLTGNQDALMTRQAESRVGGIVEQLINKPCDPSDLVQILQTGLKKCETTHAAV